ncbi:probable serine/threonine-protein kinase PBL19 isoform X2 [Phalaenopsis equestris]|nr:probable serine/threonine-protein kinase PBL19 isoform X2 [Phalaenopsis equestris]XP_020592549.1 probable serine/threonine-protein kinase PBL19 isoform X2 [Phalaenopsis equestris]
MALRHSSSSTASNDQDTKKSVSDMSTDSTGRSQFSSFSQKLNDLKIFKYEELKVATRNFSRSQMLGEGGFGCVYRGTIKNPVDLHENIEIAVKKLSRVGFQGHKEWLTEVNVLGVVEHPNLVKLVGYCAEDDERGIQRLLVYEYMQNRSVEYQLSLKVSASLSWGMRLKIALDAARGLTYLHEGMEIQIIFRDFKPSNILLDEHWHAKLSDFGLARQGPAEGLTHVSTAVVGTIGYAAPEYIQTGRLTAKSDIWSYGIFLYELITGRHPMDRNRPKNEQKLLEWIKPYVTDEKKFPFILDPRIKANCSVKSAMKLAAVANKCLIRHPKSRPKMSEVLQMVQCICDDEKAEETLQTPTNVAEEGAVACRKKRGADSKMSCGGWASKLIRAN